MEGGSGWYIRARLRSLRQWGAFLGAEESLGVVLRDDRLRVSSNSTSACFASSLELVSRLLRPAALL